MNKSTLFFAVQRAFGRCEKVGMAGEYGSERRTEIFGE